MTLQEHNKLLGILHLVQAGFGALMMLVFVPFFLFFVLAAGEEPGGGAVSAFLLLIGIIFFLLFLVLSLPSLLAGYGMLKGKGWARTWGIVAAVVASMSFPFGTALCVYTLWFLFGEGRELHGAAQGARRPGSLGAGQPLGWDARQATRGPRGEYVPPPQPPDWRGQP